MSTASDCRSWWLRVRHLHVLVAALPIALACASDSQKPPTLADDPGLYWTLDLNHHAVTLSTAPSYDTLTLTAMPQNYLGEPLTDLPAPQFVSRDVERVAVSPEGKLSAVSPTADPVWVVVSLTSANLKHADSALVRVVALNPPPVLGTFSVHPQLPDTAKFAAPTVLGGIEWTDTLPVFALSTSGAPFDPLMPVYFRSSDPSVARIGPWVSKFTSVTAKLGQGEVETYRPGSITVYASTTAFGVFKADTLSYRVGWPLIAGVEVGGPSLGLPPGTFRDVTVKIGTGGAVNWFIGQDADMPIEVDVAFAATNVANVVAIAPENAPHPFLPFLCFAVATECGSGNFVLTPAFPRALRVFTAPGTYEYQSPMHGTSARIVVVDESDD